MSAYAELAVTTNFSFLRGASHPHELMEAAKTLRLKAIGIADRNSLAGVVRAYDAIEQLPEPKPKLLVGARLVFRDGTPDILAYPTDREAYGRLCRLITEGKKRAEKGACYLDFDDLAEWQEGLLLAVMPPQHIGEETKICLEKLRQIAPKRVWLAAAMLYRGDDRRRLRKLQRIARDARVPLLAVNDVLYHTPARRELQDVVSCIREHVTLDTAGRLLEANAERHLKPADEMTRLFHDTPDAIDETVRFADRITFSLGKLQYNYPDEPVPKGKTSQQHLTELTWAGAAERYPEGVPEKVHEALEKELRLIQKLDYAPYFLTVRDIVGIAHAKNILCQGRGSAANSAVCYVLGITAVDPGEIDLLFERFISEERKEPPDIDVDFEHERREEVMQEVFERYGRDHAAITATVICYRPRSAIREVGKAFGLTEDTTAALAGSVWGSWGEGLKDSQVKQGDRDPANALIARAVSFANELVGFPRHLSQHVGGFVLTRDRLDEIVPIGNAAMDKRTFIEWDKDDIDRLRIMKVDVLALGMLTCIRKAFDLMKEHSNIDVNLATVPPEDKGVYDMLCDGDAIGVFQVESRAQMNMLPRLRPRKFYDLVIEVAIVRPGPIQGDMVHPYLRRRNGLEKVEYPSPSPEHGPANELLEVLKKTFGVPLFQEQAMKLAIVAAKFTPDEANGLRRAMATFRHMGTIHTFGDKLIGNMVARGYERDYAERCSKQIEGFGTYGFPESHAASFAQLVYVSAWIKKYHPAAFGCALLNSQPMGFYAPAEIVRDAREHHVEVRPIDVSFSEWDNTLEKRDDGTLALRLGFRQMDGFREEWAKALIATRARRLSEIADLARHAKLPKRALMALAEADCFRSLGRDRREALWAVRRLADDTALPLFAAREAEELPSETTAPLPTMPLSEHVLADYRTLRLSLKGYPMQFLRELFEGERVSSCAEIADAKDGAAASCAGIVLVRQMPGAKGVVFITLSDETGIANVVVWPKLMERFRKEVMGSRLLLVEGRVQKSNDPKSVVHLVAERLTDRTRELDRLSDDKVRPQLSRADAVAHPAGPERPTRGHHPRDVRILPKSRDFH